MNMNESLKDIITAHELLHMALGHAQLMPKNVDCGNQAIITHEYLHIALGHAQPTSDGLTVTSQAEREANQIAAMLIHPGYLF